MKFFALAKNNQNYYLLSIQYYLLSNGFDWGVFMDINEINRLHYVGAVDPDARQDRFRKGKKFHSRIKNISRDGEVELELEDGIVLNARLEERIAAGIGDIVLFEITERTEERIKLKYIPEDEDEEKRFDVRV